MPKSACLASSGPFTRQPITATVSGRSTSRGSAASRRSTSFARLDDVDLGAPAGRARDHVGAARAQAERGEDLPGDPHLFDRIAGERHAQRVADALREQRPDADGALDRPAPQRAGLGDADVQRGGVRVRGGAGPGADAPARPPHPASVRYAAIVSATLELFTLSLKSR